MTNKCTSSAGSFDGHSGAPEQYRQHRPMRHIPGYSGRYWTPPSGNYLLRITLAAARATANKKRQKNLPKRLAILMASAVRRYNTPHIAQQRRFKALLDATKHRHQVSIATNSCNWSSLPCFFSSFFIVNLYKRSQVNAKAPVFNRGIGYQTKEKGLIQVSI